MTEAAEPVAALPLDAGIVVAGASAGGVEALVALIGSLPEDFPHPVLVVLHIAPTGTSVLPSILARAGPLPVAAPSDGDRVLPGHVYVAPPDAHLVLEDGRLRLSHAPRENGHRPAIDATMRSAAEAFDGGTIGIVLSGSRDDGTAGLIAIKARGGTAIVQDPDEALYDGMPRSAMAHAEIDAVLPIAAMAPWILGRDVDPARPGGLRPMAGEGTPGNNEAAGDEGGQEDAPGKGTRFTCPDCGGVLFSRHEGPLERFRCSVGHAFSIESLSVAQAEALETALWAAVRSLEDRAAMLLRLARRAAGDGHGRTERRFLEQRREALVRAATIRDAIAGVTSEAQAAVEA